MIETVAELLAALIQSETTAFEQFSFIAHPVTQGNMYEDLTQNILRKAIFKGLDLRVVGGFIHASNEKLSNEIDCMLVCGMGQAIPGNHNKFVYNLDQVIAIIQVKKTINAHKLKDSVYNVNSIFDFSQDYLAGPHQYTMANDMFIEIAREELTSQQDYDELSPYNKRLYDSLLADSAFPLRLIWGFNGFASQTNFRTAVISFLEEQMTLDKRIIHGPEYLPNLIICGTFAIAKTNAMPYGQPLDKKSTYLVYASTTSAPLIILLEILWTRLTYLFPQLPISIFGEDLDHEVMLPLLSCSYVQKDGIDSWHYAALLSGNNNNDISHNTQWRPVAVSQMQAQVLSRLCYEPLVNYESNESIKQYIENEGQGMKEFIETLVQTGLVYLRHGSLHLLTKQCSLVKFDGQWYAGENKSGRMDRWLLRKNKRN